MTKKQELIEVILKIAPGNVDREILESRNVSELEAIYNSAKEEQEDRLLLEQAELAASQAVVEIAKKEMIEVHRPKFEAKQKRQLAVYRKVFSDAARQLETFADNDANFSLTVSVLGEGFIWPQIQQAIQEGRLQLAPAGPLQVQQWRNEKAKEQIEARNEYLQTAAQNNDTQTLRREAKVEAVQNRKTAARTAFEKELEAGLTRDLTVNGLPRLPDTWDGKTLDPAFIKQASRETLSKIMRRFGSAQLTARLHGVTKVGSFTL